MDECGGCAGAGGGGGGRQAGAAAGWLPRPPLPPCKTGAAAGRPLPKSKAGGGGGASPTGTPGAAAGAAGVAAARRTPAIYLPRPPRYIDRWPRAAAAAAAGTGLGAAGAPSCRLAGAHSRTAPLARRPHRHHLLLRRRRRSRRRCRCLVRFGPGRQPVAWFAPSVLLVAGAGRWRATSTSATTSSTRPTSATVQPGWRWKTRTPCCAGCG